MFRKACFLLLVLILIPCISHTDTVIFKDGKIIETKKAWEKDDEVKCYIDGYIIGFQKEDVERCIFRLIPATYSAPFRPPIPLDSGHLFRNISATL